MNIGQKIRDAREDMDLKQIDVAKMIHMNQSNYSKIERGIQEPNIEQLTQICRILKLDPRYLLNLTEFEFVSQSDKEILKAAKEFINKYKLEIK